MDVGQWSWQWRAAGGAAVFIFTPWAFKNLLQINWETRENVDKIAPWAVQYVRENYGFEDEDPAARAHAARMAVVAAEPTPVALLDRPWGSPVWEGVVAGTSKPSAAVAAARAGGDGTGPDSDEVRAALLSFGDLPPDPTDYDAAEVNPAHPPAPAAGAGAAQGRPSSEEQAEVIAVANRSRSLWEVPGADELEREAERAALIPEVDLIFRDAVRAAIAAVPVAPAFQRR